MLKYILLVVGLGGNGYGVGLSAEFQSKEACEAAIVAMQEQIRQGGAFHAGQAQNLSDRIGRMSVCVPKG